MSLRKKMELSVTRLSAEYPELPIILLIAPNDGEALKIELIANIQRSDICRVIMALARKMGTRPDELFVEE